MEISTTDLALAAALALEHPVTRIEKEGRRATFFFEELPKVRQLMQAFWRGECLVDPQRYYTQLKMLKSRIYDDTN